MFDNQKIMFYRVAFNIVFRDDIVELIIMFIDAVDNCRYRIGFMMNFLFIIFSII